MLSSASRFQTTASGISPDSRSYDNNMSSNTTSSSFVSDDEERYFKQTKVQCRFSNVPGKWLGRPFVWHCYYVSLLLLLGRSRGAESGICDSQMRTRDGGRSWVWTTQWTIHRYRKHDWTNERMNEQTKERLFLANWTTRTDSRKRIMKSITTLFSLFSLRSLFPLPSPSLRFKVHVETLTNKLTESVYSNENKIQPIG